MRQAFMFAFVALVGVACSVRKSDVIGTYTIRHQRNNVDTLRLLPNGTYVRHLVAKRNAFRFTNSDRWEYRGDRLTLYNYLIDEDNQYTPDSNVEQLGITASLPVERKKGKVIILYRLDSDNFYYEKL